MSVARIQPVR